MSGGCFHTLSLAQFRRTVDELHARVAQGHGRIEITCDQGINVCVLLSKAELDALERALEILSETADFRSMCESLNSLATGEEPEPASQPL